ncbi:MAG TPA: hypothetical protein PK103_08360 [Elusimicrobiales bacterium]|nr:hypothetical protein [Elusimicrobiales bacterium]HPO96012.1 hypothetical protein [Elusimicrobiales bacterium]
MKKIIFSGLFMSLTSMVFGEFEGTNITKIKELDNISNPKLIIDAKYSKAYTNIWMNVYINESMKEINAYDYSKQMEIRLRKVFDTNFEANLNVDRKFEYLNIRKFSNAYEFSNYNGNLRIARWGESYDITGNVKDENGKYKYINLTVFKRFSDEFSFAINTGGLNIYFDKYSVNGNFDETVYSKKIVSYIISMVLTVEADNMGDKTRPEDKN